MFDIQQLLEQTDEAEILSAQKICSTCIVVFLQQRHNDLQKCKAAIIKVAVCIDDPEVL